MSQQEIDKLQSLLSEAFMAETQYVIADQNVVPNNAQQGNYAFQNNNQNNQLQLQKIQLQQQEIQQAQINLRNQQQMLNTLQIEEQNKANELQRMEDQVKQLCLNNLPDLIKIQDKQELDQLLSKFQSELQKLKEQNQDLEIKGQQNAEQIKNLDQQSLKLNAEIQQQNNLIQNLEQELNITT